MLITIAILQIKDHFIPVVMALISFVSNLVAYPVFNNAQPDVQEKRGN